MNKSNQAYLEVLCGGLETKDVEMLNHYVQQLEERIDIPRVQKNEMVHDFLRAIAYYLDHNYSTSEIIERLDLRNLGEYYRNIHETCYMIDNAGVIYPLGLRNGQMQMFRLSITLKEDIVPELLQIAVNFTMKRFPTFAAAVKGGVFWPYLETNHGIIKVEEETDIPCKPISIVLRTSRSLRILYYKKRISIEIFHVVTDGTGGMVFLKTLTNEYLRLLKNVSVCGEGILDINEEVNKEEVKNCFDDAESNKDISMMMGEKSLQLKGKITTIKPSRIFHYEMPLEQLKEVSKKYNSTISAYILALMFIASKRAIDKTSGVFRIQVPINMRQFNQSKTLRNYSMYFGASMDIKDIGDKQSVVDEMKKQLKENVSYDRLSKMMGSTKGIIDMARPVPLFIKIPIGQIAFGYLGNSIYGATFSNLGIIEVGDNIKEYIDYFDFVVVPNSPNRIFCTLLTYEGKSRLMIAKNTQDTTFEEEMLKLLKEDGITIDLYGSPRYES